MLLTEADLSYDPILIQFEPRGISYAEFAASDSIKAVAFARASLFGIRNLSRVYLYREGESMGAERWKHQAVSLLRGWFFGWRSLVNLIEVVRFNKEGLDLTIDVKGNVDEHAWVKREFVFEKEVELFHKPDRETVQGFRKAVSKHQKENSALSGDVIVGTHLEYERNRETVYVALDTQDERHWEALKARCNKIFRSHVEFELVPATETSAWMREKLQEQGLTIAREDFR